MNGNLSNSEPIFSRAKIEAAFEVSKILYEPCDGPERLMCSRENTNFVMRTKVFALRFSSGHCACFIALGKQPL
jgi:hypothetical protein